MSESFAWCEFIVNLLFSMCFIFYGWAFYSVKRGQMEVDLALVGQLVEESCFMDEKINAIFVQFYKESP